MQRRDGEFNMQQRKSNLIAVKATNGHASVVAIDLCLRATNFKSYVVDMDIQIRLFSTLGASVRLQAS